MADKQVFVSYSSPDSEVAGEVAKDLREQGLTVWLDDASFTPGERIQDTIRAELDRADAFVVVISPDSENSRWSRYELSEIVKRTWADPSKQVIPIVIGDAELPGYLRDRRSVRVESPGYHLESIVRALLEEGFELEPEQAATGRSDEGELRLDRRLADLEREATEMPDSDAASG